MTPLSLQCLAAFVAGCGVGVLLGAWFVVAERRAALRARLQQPPFTTEGAGR